MRRLEDIVAEFLRNLLKVYVTANRWLPADRIVSGVVENDVRKVLAPRLSDNRHVAHLHDACTIAVQTIYFTVGLRLGDSKGNHRRMPHRADRQEIAFVSLTETLARFIHLTRDHAGRRNDHGIFRQRLQHALDCLFTRKRRDVRFLVLQLVFREEPLADNQRNWARFSFRTFDHFPRHVQCSSLIVRQNLGRDTERLEERNRYLALLDVLRLILHARLSTPSNQKHHRDRIDIWIGKRTQRIHRIPLPRILHVHQCGPARRQIMPRRQTNRPALIRSDHMILLAHIRHIRAEALQQRIRHAGEELHAGVFQTFHKILNFNHILLQTTPIPNPIKNLYTFYMFYTAIIVQPLLLPIRFGRGIVIHSKL